MRLLDFLKKLLDLLHSPSRRRCPYCHGGKCLGACQLIEEKKNNSPPKS